MCVREIQLMRRQYLGLYILRSLGGSDYTGGHYSCVADIIGDRKQMYITLMHYRTMIWTWTMIGEVSPYEV